MLALRCNGGATKNNFNKHHQAARTTNQRFELLHQYLKEKIKTEQSPREQFRIKGYPTVCDHYDRKQEAEDWAADVEREIMLGKFNFDQHKQQYTFNQLIDRYINDGALQHICSAKDVIPHLDYWKTRLGNNYLVHITPDLIGKERQYLTNKPTVKGNKPSSATINRYISSLSSILSYDKRLRWIDETPCFNLTKFKENPHRDRVLSENEISKLLIACRQSKSPYLYCIVLMSLTTRARQGEILDLEWRHVDFENKLSYVKETKNGNLKKLYIKVKTTEDEKGYYFKLSTRETQKLILHLVERCTCRVTNARSAEAVIEVLKTWNEFTTNTATSAIKTLNRIGSGVFQFTKYKIKD